MTSPKAPADGAAHRLARFGPASRGWLGPLHRHRLLGAEPYKRVLYAAMRAAFDAGPDLVADAERLLAVLRCEAAKHLAEAVPDAVVEEQERLFWQRLPEAEGLELPHPEVEPPPATPALTSDPPSASPAPASESSGEKSPAAAEMADDPAGLPFLSQLPPLPPVDHAQRIRDAVRNGTLPRPTTAGADQALGLGAPATSPPPDGGEGPIPATPVSLSQEEPGPSAPTTTAKAPSRSAAEPYAPPARSANPPPRPKPALLEDRHPRRGQRSGGKKDQKRDHLGRCVADQLEDRLRDPGLWAYPRKEDLPALRAAYLGYSLVNVGKYHAKVQVLRLRRLLDACSHSQCRDPQAKGLWLRRYVARTAEEEVVTSRAGRRALAALRTALPPICRWGGEDETFVVDGGVQGMELVRRVVDWDDRKVLVTGGVSEQRNYLFNQYETFEPVPGRLECFRFNKEAQQIRTAADIYRLQNRLQPAGADSDGGGAGPRALPPHPGEDLQPLSLDCPFFRPHCLRLFLPPGRSLAPPSSPNAVRHVILTPSYRRAHIALLDYRLPADVSYLQILLVRPEESEAYRRHLRGPRLALLELPPALDLDGVAAHLPGDGGAALQKCGRWRPMLTIERGGVGYARLVGQLFAQWQGWPAVWFLDDNVLAFHRLDVSSLCQDGDHRRRHAPTPITMADMLRSIEEQFTKENECGQADDYAVLGTKRQAASYQSVYRPFASCPVFSAFLLNVRATCRRGLLVPPKPFWEDIEFCQMCSEAGLAVCRYNTFYHTKRNFQVQLRRDLGKAAEHPETWHVAPPRPASPGLRTQPLRPFPEAPHPLPADTAAASPRDATEGSVRSSSSVRSGSGSGSSGHPPDRRPRDGPPAERRKDPEDDARPSTGGKEKDLLDRLEELMWLRAHRKGPLPEGLEAELRRLRDAPSPPPRKRQARRQYESLREDLIGCPLVYASAPPGEDGRPGRDPGGAGHRAGQGEGKGVGESPA